MVDNPAFLLSSVGCPRYSGRSVEIALIDFHTHSAASDGSLSPRDLTDRAVSEGVCRLAITDHDTIAGYLSVCRSVPPGLELISGVELSCQWGRAGIHIVGLGFDPASPALVKHLEGLDKARKDRAEKIAYKLDRSGMPGALAGAMAVAAGAQIGRPHFARWMVLAGHVDNEQLAFKQFLGRGKPGDISLLWPTLDDTVATINGAGGVSVLAHPLDYKMTATRLRALTDAFHEAGGQALEVINGRPRPGDKDTLWRLVRERDLQVSVGSDFHRDSPYGAGLGVDVTEIPEGMGVWEQL
jgi:predicted metal-dependent phosphoesterase TrpH